MRTSPTWMLPFTLRVMMRPLSRPSRTRTLTWTASPVIPVRPSLASLHALRDLVQPLADFPALLRELDRLIGLVDELFRHLETNVHWLGHRGDLLPSRGRGTSSVIGSPSSEKRPSKWRGL